MEEISGYVEEQDGYASGTHHFLTQEDKIGAFDVLYEIASHNTLGVI